MLVITCPELSKIAIVKFIGEGHKIEFGLRMIGLNDNSITSENLTTKSFTDDYTVIATNPAKFLKK